MPYFTSEQIASLRAKPLPEHVAIVPDGNRRWAKNNRFSQLKQVMAGHSAGAEVLPGVVGAALELGIKTLTVWGASTENLKREASEVAVLFTIFEDYIRDHLSHMITSGIRFEVIGDPRPLPEKLKKIINEAKEATRHNGAMRFVVALNYGGRDDLKRACQKIVGACVSGKIAADEITEETMAHFLDTAGLQDPDLLIRTGGEMRISNFLIWQLAYTEIYVTDLYWPDFTPAALLEAIANFQHRQRRMGR